MAHTAISQQIIVYFALEIVLRYVPALYRPATPHDEPINHTPTVCPSMLYKDHTILFSLVSVPFLLRINLFDCHSALPTIVSTLLCQSDRVTR